MVFRDFFANNQMFIEKPGMALLRTVLFVGQEFGILPLISQSSAPEE